MATRIVGAIGEQMLPQGQRFRMLLRMTCPPALIEISAVVALTINKRPSESTTMCRLRPTTFCPRQARAFPPLVP